MNSAISLWENCELVPKWGKQPTLTETSYDSDDDDSTIGMIDFSVSLNLPEEHRVAFFPSEQPHVMG